MTMMKQTLGYAEVTANQDGISTEADLTGLTVTVRVGTNRRIRITGHGQVNHDAANLVTGAIKEDTTVLGRWCQHVSGAAEAFGADAAVVITPTAGAHTYKLTLLASTSTVDLQASATVPAYILVEDIT